MKISGDVQNKDDLAQLREAIAGSPEVIRMIYDPALSPYGFVFDDLPAINEIKVGATLAAMWDFRAAALDVQAAPDPAIMN